MQEKYSRLDLSTGVKIISVLRIYFFLLWRSDIYTLTRVEKEEEIKRKETKLLDPNNNNEGFTKLHIRTYIQCRISIIMLYAHIYDIIFSLLLSVPPWLQLLLILWVGDTFSWQELNIYTTNAIQ